MEVEFKENFKISELTTFKVGGIVKKIYFPKNQQELSKEQNVNLYLLGYRSDVKELLKMADTYILPSFREGLNVSVMEAMASGLPVICSNIRGNVDMVTDGENGYLMNPKDKIHSLELIKREFIRDKAMDKDKSEHSEFR